MRVKLNGNLYRRFQRLYQLIGGIRLKQTRHVLDTDTVGSFVLQLLGELHEFFVCVNGAESVADTALEMSALFLCRFYGGFRRRKL